MRVLRHFAFVDLSGFTSLTDQEGDERAVGVVTAFRALLRDVCSRRGVRIAKWLGDGAMMVTVDATPLLAAALEVERAAGLALLPVPARWGASSGEVILLEGDDYIGHSVNLAARLCDIAPGGVALIERSMLEFLPKWGTVLKSEELTIRGIERPVNVASIGFAELKPPIAADPICGIPLSREVAAERMHDLFGHELWFCSDSCRDTWERRPHPLSEGQGSLRTPLIGA